MTEHNYFDTEGHLTDFALHELVDGEPDELARLEIAEHLSFCDPCTERYTEFLCGTALMEPEHPVAPTVMGGLRKRARTIFLSRYVTAGVAASFSIFFWVTGVFHPTMPQAGFQAMDRLDTFATSITETVASIGENFSFGVGDFFANLDLKGAFDHEKK